MSVTSSGCASRSAARSTLPRRADFVAAPLLPVHERVHIAFRDIEIPLQVSPRREERRRIESEPPAFEQVMQGSIPLAQAVRTLVPLLVKQHRCPDFPEHPFQRQRCDFHGDLPRLPSLRVQASSVDIFLYGSTKIPSPQDTRRHQKRPLQAASPGVPDWGTRRKARTCSGQISQLRTHASRRAKIRRRCSPDCDDACHLTNGGRDTRDSRRLCLSRGR